MRFELQPDTELLEHLCENNAGLGSCSNTEGRDQAAPPTTGNSDENRFAIALCIASLARRTGDRRTIRSRLNLTRLTIKLTGR